MKKYLLLSLAAAFLLGACTEKETDPVLQVGAVPTFTSPSGGAAFVLTEANADALFTDFSWTPADFGFRAGVTYTLEVDKAGNNFADPTTVGTSNGTELKGTTQAKINNILLGKGIPGEEESDVEFRLVASVSSEVEKVYSPTLTLKITPYTVVIVYPQLQVPGSYQGWAPTDNNTVIFSVRSDEKYEGYIYFPDPNAEYKFTKGLSWDVNWGDTGADGTLDPAGENIKQVEAGMYRLNVDLNALTHSSVKTSWGLIGSATPTGWDSDTDLVYDPASRKYTLTIDLTAGNAIKFRANDAWDINLGDDGANRSLEYGGADIVIAESGNYTVELTLSAAVYTYKLTKN